MTENERVNLAARIYVRMRHAAGRTIDAIWMAQDSLYAQEVIRLARGHADSELRYLADRFEQLVFGRPVVTVNGASHEDTADFSSTTEMELARYRGSLR